MGTQKIGSTLKGIGPVYTDKVARNGLRIGDLEESNFREKYERLKTQHISIIKNKHLLESLKEKEEKFFVGIQTILNLELVDGEYFINDLLKNGKKVLGEGAQGSMLDIDFGSYPFVTSSNTTSAGACTGLGISPHQIQKVIGIFKAYCTRVGGGPFPSELLDETGDYLRKVGNEFGATTGRPRRCGWIDLPALRYAIMLNGVTNLVMTKADVLSGFSKIKVCTHYEYGGKIQNNLPFDLCRTDLKPVYLELEGWNENLTKLINPKKLPKPLINYIHFLEKELGVPISYLSVGPDRIQTLILKPLPIA
jgi:adenylosuccinate synthase